MVQGMRKELERLESFLGKHREISEKVDVQMGRFDKYIDALDKIQIHFFGEVGVDVTDQMKTIWKGIVNLPGFREADDAGFNPNWDYGSVKPRGKGVYTMRVWVKDDWVIKTASGKEVDFVIDIYVKYGDKIEVISKSGGKTIQSKKYGMSTTVGSIANDIVAGWEKYYTGDARYSKGGR